ncbi:hypothetical protein PF005_g16682 [Phytophthora fragariae]|uniref:Secreted protein n=1 Tax=Phytophthora fragariae TaxID=53985 RepID=A0A6A3FQI3_9STRA|nr:hypothetical protein PF003_g31085 [Phytophthora fragariae]KAE8946671.1 hypothetical protein PF009_g3709 [Phytophthora fragariae]KAE8988040.1 hypothetical protein PF011_g19330 [Phytophthora fragariae]KAE9087849.1 hypothetical protein PF007_g20218 [Phytophthora fragariae]KAE9097938.1 hypothetical protein PF010_g15764 [Phytophthora fragariae]
MLRSSLFASSFPWWLAQVLSLQGAFEYAGCQGCRGPLGDVSCARSSSQVPQGSTTAPQGGTHACRTRAACPN